MTSIDYDTYAKTLNSWYNDEEFISLRTVSELCNIFDKCSFTTKQYKTTFSIISRKFNTSDVSTLSQHAKIDNFEDTQAAFEILNFISRILNHNTLRDISVFVQTHKYHRLIKYEKGEHGNDILTIMGNAAVTFDHDGIIVEEQE